MVKELLCWLPGEEGVGWFGRSFEGPLRGRPGLLYLRSTYLIVCGGMLQGPFARRTPCNKASKARARAAR